MSDKQKGNNNKKLMNEASALNKVASNFLNFSDPKRPSLNTINGKAAKFQDIINKPMDISKGMSNGLILDFYQARKNEEKTNLNRQGNGLPVQQTVNEQLQASSADLYSLYQDMYQNKYLEIADYKFISKFIPALGEAVKTTLDSIVSSDNLTASINRIIQFDSSVDKNKQSMAMEIIGREEKNLKLLNKLKNTVYKTTLVSGTYYVYAKSYSDLYKEYAEAKNRKLESLDNKPGQKRTKNAGMKTKKVTESTESVYDGVIESYDVPTSFDAVAVFESSGVKKEKTNKNKFVDYFKDNLATIKHINSPILESAMQEIELMESLQESSYSKYFNNNTTDFDMEVGVGNSKTVGQIGTDYSKVHGTYLVYLEPRKMVPIEILGEKVGYYYIGSKTKRRSEQNNDMNNMGSLFSSVSIPNNKKENVVDSIVSSLATDIMNEFNPKFVEHNLEFKKAIADCIMFNGFINNEFHVQFIPAKDVIEFKVNENENGDGTSILADSLFPAKLLLSLIVSKMLNYINKSGDKRLVYINKGPINSDTGNQIQRVIRNMQETQITFSDLVSSNLVFNKFAGNQNILVPTSTGGKRLLEFETMEGMNVDMDPEYERMLEQMAIMGTSVPSVIMEYVGQTDFAKGFETGNIKYAGRIANMQSDLEEPTTELYNMIIQNSDMDEETKKALNNKFNFKLPRPQVLANNNNSEYLSTLQSLLELVSNMIYGDPDTPPTEKSIFTELALMHFATFIDWKVMEDLQTQAKLKHKKTSEQITDAQAANNVTTAGDDLGSDSGGGEDDLDF